MLFPNLEPKIGLERSVPYSERMMKAYRIAVLVVVLLGVGLWLHGQATKPSTAPSISPAAQSLLNDVKDAYGKLKSLELNGTVSINLDAAGEKSDEKASFSSSYQAPDKFRHEMKDDLLMVSNGEKAFIYKPDAKKYATLDPIKERAAAEDLPAPVGAQLQQQNPSLLLALVKDAGAELAADVNSVDVEPDAKIDGQDFKVLLLKGQGQQMRVSIDPQTKLIRRITSDVKDRLVERGVPQVNSALLTIDYSKVAADQNVDAAQFAWVPPADAILVKLQADAQGEGGEEAAMALVGKPAADFTLKDLDGKDVSFASLKGNVVVLDFWATWCGPCRASMPHLNALNNDLSPRGLKVYAIDQGETKSAVQEFLKAEKLTLPVLLDENSKVGELYKVSGIPQTVVIGKDGIIKKVIIGYGPGGEDELRKEVESAMKG
jgi:peroxiredoxin/outer membrane lipoprotein-sorting protein